MRQLPVKQLTAEQIELGGKILLTQNGDLMFDGDIIARYEDLIDVLVVPDTSAFNLLTPKIGDIAKIDDSNTSYIYNGVWIPLFREDINVFNVLYESELDDLNPTVGYMVRVTSIYKNGIYDGTNWIYLLGGAGAVIEDLLINSNTAWSSAKILAELDLKQNIITPGVGLIKTDDTLDVEFGNTTGTALEGDSGIDDLSDVDTSTIAPEDGHILKYDTDKWVPAVDGVDTSEGIDMTNNDLYNTKAVSFSVLYDYGIKSADFSIDFINGVYQIVTIDGNCLLNIIEPTSPCTFYLHIHQGATGGIITFPSVGWTRGVVRENTTTPNIGHDLLMVHYYGNNNYVFEMIENII